MRTRVQFEKDGIIIEVIPFRDHKRADKAINKFLKPYTIYERAERGIRAVKSHH